MRPSPGRHGYRDLPELLHLADPAMRTCPGGHSPDTACRRDNLTWSSSNLPRFWQWPLYGTTDWERLYSKRGAVERSYAHLKSAAGPGLRRDDFRVRGLGKIGVVMLADVIASNLGKVYNVSGGDHEIHHREDLHLAARPLPVVPPHAEGPRPSGRGPSAFHTDEFSTFDRQVPDLDILQDHARNS